eukprot:CAMPEP_0194137860 /NCGR_PEP_ID=MMETSP0152-20130528/7689_1 /TAXON_ID=1049557 /ORGANISM="Thalassiothrix antarctica, Strain L6-D1" /LENGTH=297 /DNA_ID=CAMNT_0038835037 /DNA_START=44 /DNA_END=937 /DNA_ORIENTATION=+
MTDLYSKFFGSSGTNDNPPDLFSFRRNNNINKTFSEDDYYSNIEALADNNVYPMRQKRGYLSILFSIMQILILLLMMIKGGLAPLNVNPMVGPYPETLDNWGAKDTEKIVHDGEWWRIFPCPVFLHAGVFHLLGNISVQLDMGAFFEREWGSLVWFIIYAGSGIGSSILSVCIIPDSISVGSSGAVCGLFGAKLAELLILKLNRYSSSTVEERIGHVIRREQLVHILINVVIVGAFSFIPFVDWAAHLGGFISGITIGIVFFSCMIRQPVLLYSCVMVGIVLTISVFSWGIRSMYGK